MFFRKGPRATPRKPARSNFGFIIREVPVFDYICLKVLKVFHLGRQWRKAPLYQGVARCRLGKLKMKEVQVGRKQAAACCLPLIY